MPQVLCALVLSLSACADPDHEPIDEEMVGSVEEAIVSTQCPDGHVCFWPLQNYGGNRRDWGAQNAKDWTYVNGMNAQKYYSLKNRFADRVVWTAKPNQQIHCTPPNGQRPTAPEFSVFCIGPKSSTCSWDPANWCK